VTENTAGQRPQANRAGGNDLLARTVSALVLAFLALVGAVLGSWPAAIVLGVVTAIVHLEWASLTDKSAWPSAVFTAGLVVSLAMIMLGLVQGGLIIIGLAIVAAAATMDRWRPVGVAYAATVGAGLLLLRLSPDGFIAILLVLAVVWATDTGAFAVGRLVGGAKLWPAVSPAKTWSGAIGGAVVGLVAGLIVAAWFNLSISLPLVLVIVGL
jgi:phosphatidate cytidylyltransferase